MSKDFQRRLRGVVDKMPEDLQTQAKRLIGRLLKMNLNSSESLQSLMRDGEADSKLRVLACWLLGQLGDKQAVGAVLFAFREGDVDLQWEAAKSLGLIASKRAVKPLIVALLHAPSADKSSLEKRTAAAYALGLLKDMRAIEPLVRVLNGKNEHPKLRSQAAEALANFNHPEVIDSLLKALKDKEPEVRFWAVYALGQLKAKKALPVLKRLAEKDHTLVPNWWTVDREAINAIEYINSHIDVPSGA